MATNITTELFGLTTSVTFQENTVNASPQLIDTSVTFVDFQNNLNGGHLTITGLLTEDSVAINNQGTGGGQIGVSGSNITYGGVVIGSYTGGNAGNSLNVTFNSSATSVAVDALIQNLTYANSSNTPTADRNLVLDVTDSLGAHIPGAASFSQAAAASSPIHNLPIVQTERVGFGDIDGDGDLDAVLGSYGSGPRTFTNNGNGTWTERTGGSNPFGNDPDYYTKATFFDIDGDGDDDALIGGDNGALGGHFLSVYIQGADHSFTEKTGAQNPFNAFNINPSDHDDREAPTAVDVDGDGDLDIVTGSGHLYYIRNDAGTFNEQVGSNNPFSAIVPSGIGVPAFVDLDGDGDMDMVLGGHLGLRTFQNNAGVFQELMGANNPFSAVTTTDYTAPVAVDFDGDGDLDLVVAITGNGTDEPLYFVNNGGFGHTIAVHVNAEAEANTAPTVNANTGLTLNEGATGTITAAKLDFNDAEQADTAIVYTIGTATTHGTVFKSGVGLTAGGTFTQDDLDNNRITYTHDGGETTSDSFAFSVSDGAGGTVAGQTFNLTVTAVNDAPTISVTTTASDAVQGGAAIIALSAVTVGDVDNANLQSATVTITNAQTGDILAAATAGTSITANYNSTSHTLTLTGSDTLAHYQQVLGAVTFQDTGTDASTGSHPTRTITWQVNDGALSAVTGGSTTLTIDRAPTLTADSYSVVESASATGTSGTAGTGVLGNDSDKDGDTLTISAVNGSGANVASGTFQGTYGHLNLAADGHFTYSADNTSAIDSGATGSHLTDTFTYTVGDGLGGTTSSTVTLTIDRAPTMVADTGASQAVESGSAVTDNVLTNDSDRDGDTLVVSAVAGVSGNVGNSTATTYGHVTISTDGSYTYSGDNTVAIDAALQGSHLTDTVTYTANDGHGGTSTTSLTVTLDRGPTVVGDSNSAAQNVTVAMTALTGVLTNDSDRDGDTLAVSAVGGSAGNVGGSFATTYGHITLNADGSYSYIADNAAALAGAANGSRPVDAISFTVSDGHGGTTAETLNITVDRAATATADSLSTNENANAVSGSGGNANLLANDVDKDGDAIVVTAVNGVGGNVGSQITLASGALLTLNANGTYTYNPNHVFDYLDAASHATDSFTYTITGGSTVTVTVTVNGVDFDDTVNGTSGDDHINAGAGDDTIFVTGGGNDTVNGGTGDDTIRFGTSFTAGDSIDGGANNDRVIISGDYSAGVVFGPATMTNVETLQLSSGHAYNLTTNDTTVAAGKVMTVIGTGTTQLTFDGSAETDGSFQIYDGAGNDAVTGGGGKDIFKMGGGGTDTVHGGGGGDLIYMSSTLTAADVIDGGAGKDTLDLDGDYTAANALVFGATTMSNVEIVALEAAHSYDLTLNDANLAAGVVLTVKAGTLGAGDALSFNGSAETDGRFSIASGAGNDHLIGGANADSLAAGNGTNTIEGGGGKDTLSGGIGPDTFVYATAAASSGAVYDTVVGFDAASDMFDVQGTIGGIDTTIASGKLTTAHINADLTALVGSTQLLANHAVLVKPDTGNLAGHTFLVVDQNGIAGYQTGADIVIDLQSASLTAFGTHNFV